MIILIWTGCVPQINTHFAIAKGLCGKMGEDNAGAGRPMTDSAPAGRDGAGKKRLWGRYEAPHPENRGARYACCTAKIVIKATKSEIGLVTNRLECRARLRLRDRQFGRLHPMIAPETLVSPPPAGAAKERAGAHIIRIMKNIRRFSLLRILANDGSLSLSTRIEIAGKVPKGFTMERTI